MRSRVVRRVAAALGLAATGMLAIAVPSVASEDPHWPKQWAPVRIGAPTAWATTTGAGITIGIVDTGVDLNHEDLAGRIVGHTACVATGGDPARCAGSGQDEDGHGTHVAGIAAASKDNGRGIAGIAPDAKLLVAKVFSGDSASLEDVRAGIRWVVDRGANVVNLSLETTSFLGLFGGGSADLAAAVEYAWTRGAIPVLAAGNASLFSSSANYGGANAVVVGATGPNDELASYSVPTGSAKWSLVAPGGNVARGGRDSAIYSLFLPNSYAYIEGTSMAVPHVSGALALLLSRGLSPSRAVEVLLANADRAVSCGGGSPTCAGRLDVARAVAAAGGPPPTVAPTTAPPTTVPLPTVAPTTAPPTTAPPTAAAPTTAAPTTAPSAAAPTTSRPTTTTRGSAALSAPTTPAAAPQPPDELSGVTPPEVAVPPSGDGAAPSQSPGNDDAADESSAAVAVGRAEQGEDGRPAGFRGAVAVALALLAVSMAGLVVRPPAR